MLTSGSGFKDNLGSRLAFATGTAKTCFLSTKTDTTLVKACALTTASVAPGAPSQVPKLRSASVQALIGATLNSGLFARRRLSSLLQDATAGKIATVRFTSLKQVSTGLDTCLDSGSHSCARCVFDKMIDKGATGR